MIFMVYIGSFGLKKGVYNFLGSFFFFINAFMITFYLFLFFIIIIVFRFAQNISY